MHIHILGICGTFMGGIAAIAREAGHQVTGCDAGVYPPMSDQLRALGIDLIEGYGADQLSIGPDLWIIGNAISRGNPLLEAILDSGARYQSGPQWLAEQVLAGRHVLAVAGTHGKTTTTAMLAWILECAGSAPGFLIGGAPLDFERSARLGTGRAFVIEADEYDTAFFDKRSKFIHYRPRTLILNNLEFDHADIFADLAAIETQFHHLVRTVPRSGQVVVNAQAPALARVLARGCWSEVQSFLTDQDWNIGELTERGALSPAGFTVLRRGAPLGLCTLPQPGAHNRANALAALAAASAFGVDAREAVEALSRFGGVRRRLQLRGEVRGVAVIDDFAHHPTAISETIAALREHTRGSERILAVFEPRSNTMKLGTMRAQLAGSLARADRIYCYAGALSWNPADDLTALGARASVETDLDRLVAQIAAEARAGDRILVMSNGGFGGIHARLLAALDTP
jgi:UDP-N-acetylmuramate: L-alanyl-gamma-D-glutamyl-meso-diaminopimelate ligase